MPDRVKFSSQIIDLKAYAIHFDDTERALRLYFSRASQLSGNRFVGYSPAELASQLRDRLGENEAVSAMTVLAAVEAAFRVDYLQRCYARKKDAVSRAFRQLHKKKSARASLEDEILVVWKENTKGTTEIIAALKGAFKFRHWLAHGRYWEPKLGQNYDFITVYCLAMSALTQFPLYRA